MQCPKCGKSFDSKFCPDCGYKLEDEYAEGPEIKQSRKHLNPACLIIAIATLAFMVYIAFQKIPFFMAFGISTFTGAITYAIFIYLNHKKKEPIKAHLLGFVCCFALSAITVALYGDAWDTDELSNSVYSSQASEKLNPVPKVREANSLKSDDHIKDLSNASTASAVYEAVPSALQSSTQENAPESNMKKEPEKPATKESLKENIVIPQSDIQSSSQSKASEIAPVKSNPLSMALQSIGLTEQEVESESPKFTAVGISSLTSITTGIGQGIDSLQSFAATAQNGEKIYFTLENRKVFYIGYYDTDLYDSEKGGALAAIESVNVPKTDVSFAMQATLQTLTEDTVKMVLMAPSTAKFPWYDGWSFSRKDDIYTVSGYVDAQNAFGAMIRSYFTMQWRENKETGKIKAVKFVFDANEIPIK